MSSKRLLIGLGGIFATPIIATIVAQFISQILTLRQITQLFPRPQLPSIQLPFTPLQPPSLVISGQVSNPTLQAQVQTSIESSEVNSTLVVNMGRQITQSLVNATLVGQMTTSVSTSVT